MRADHRGDDAALDNKIHFPDPVKGDGVVTLHVALL